MVFEPSKTIRILIVYYSRFGVIERLAECIAEGAREEERAEIDLLKVPDRPIEEPEPGSDETEMARHRAAILNRLTAADALIVGSPGYFGSMASPVKRLFEDCATASNPPITDRTRPWRHFRFHNKIGAAFTATGTPHGGNEQTLHSILTMFMHFGMIVVTPGQQQPILENETPVYGSTAISGAEGDRMPSPAEEDVARALGRRVAEITMSFKIGSAEWAGIQEKRRRAHARGSERPG